jgi:hypothetical protein
MKTAKTKPPKSVSRFTLHESASASALILAVVLTSLLAIIGVMFVMIARVDKMATSAISENKELNFAVETVVALVSQELVLDVPGMPKGQEYYDYPDANNAWLASLEPYKNGTVYKWRQISDVTGFLNVKNFATQDVSVDPPGTRKYIQEYPEITLDANSELEELWADADGDGIADSKWIKLDDVTSNKGKPIYAAIRIVDNGGMINVNTAYKFDPNVGPANANLIDGSSQMQINLAALSQRGANGSLATAADKLQALRCGTEPTDLSLYERNVVWRYSEPNGGYTPFDISDELELRNRFILDQHYIKTRIEDKDKLWSDAFCGEYYLWTPVDGTSCNLAGWFYKAQNDFQDPNAVEPEKDYSYRHIGTIYNMDRIIDPNGRKMININRDANSSIYGAIKSALYPNLTDANKVTAQITANLIDYVDGPDYPTSDPRYDPCDNVTVVYDDVNIPYYGFERPCIYISEVAYTFVKLTIGAPLDSLLRKSYAIELYKPYPEDNYPEPNQWRLNIQGYGTVDVNWSGTKHFHVIYLEDPCALLPPVIFDSSDSDPDFPSRPYVQTTPPLPYNTIITSVSLERFTSAGWISVDSNDVPSWLTQTLSSGSIPLQSRQRDITLHKCIRRLWDSNVRDPNLGYGNSYVDPNSLLIQAHPADSNFTNVGEIGMLFRKSAYEIVSADTEVTARLNLADPCYQNLFQYLTKFDPNADGIDNDGDGTIDNGELKVPGRININTAPWYVLAQLPWVSQRKGGYDDANLARAIVAYRDKVDLSPSGGPNYSGPNGRDTGTGMIGLREAPGFNSIGELAAVINNSNKDNYSMNYYILGTEKGDLAGFPDLTTPDHPLGGAPDDFEERDVIFARISNLVTVRSDVFTAYILVRIGTDGPQKRVMAILDRSNVYSPTDKVRVVALHPVPDPR